MHHLTVRVAWHDSLWNGSICQGASKNSFCLALDRVRAERNDEQEDALAGRFWHELAQDQLPPCIAESAGFMNEQEWRRQFDHPYRDNKKAAATHGCLQPTAVRVPPFSTFAVPFAWMLKENQDRIQAACPTQLPPDEDAPFPSPRPPRRRLSPSSLMTSGGTARSTSGPCSAATSTEKRRPSS